MGVHVREARQEVLPAAVDADGVGGNNRLRGGPDPGDAAVADDDRLVGDHAGADDRNHRDIHERGRLGNNLEDQGQQHGRLDETGPRVTSSHR